MRPKYLITVASLLAVTGVNSAWGKQEDKSSAPPKQQAVPTHTAPSGSASAPCAQFDEWSNKWRECMKANVPCFATHGKAYEGCCEVEKDSPAC
jgi:hypothetical protein